MISRMAALLLFLLVPSVGVVSSAPIESDEVRVIDGDTIRIHHQTPDVRLVGFNARPKLAVQSANRSAS
jgi:endonuclease YncB( thermonuclease family)